ncbi:MAG: rod-binding protein [Deltaproteobacteria bacterium]|nr:rod-binding protein [Deltaproteobacteria bacterium]
MRFNANLPVLSDERTIRNQMKAEGQKTALSAQEMQRLKDTAQEFEALLLERMVKDMRLSIPRADLFGDSQAQDLFQEMLDGEYSRLMTRRGGIGVADFMVSRMSPHAANADKGKTGLKFQAALPIR